MRRFCLCLRVEFLLVNEERVISLLERIRTHGGESLAINLSIWQISLANIPTCSNPETDILPTDFFYLFFSRKL